MNFIPNNVSEPIGLNQYPLWFYTRGGTNRNAFIDGDGFIAFDEPRNWLYDGPVYYQTIPFGTAQSERTAKLFAEFVVRCLPGDSIISALAPQHTRRVIRPLSLDRFSTLLAEAMDVDDGNFRPIPTYVQELFYYMELKLPFIRDRNHPNRRPQYFTKIAPLRFFLQRGQLIYSNGRVQDPGSDVLLTALNSSDAEIFKHSELTNFGIFRTSPQRPQQNITPSPLNFSRGVKRRATARDMFYNAARIPPGQPPMNNLSVLRLDEPQHLDQHFWKRLRYMGVFGEIQMLTVDWGREEELEYTQTQPVNELREIGEVEEAPPPPMKKIPIRRGKVIVAGNKRKTSVRVLKALLKTTTAKLEVLKRKKASKSQTARTRFTTADNGELRKLQRDVDGLKRRVKAGEIAAHHQNLTGRRRGAFFPFFNRTVFDLSRYQIYQQTQAHKLLEDNKKKNSNVLIHCFLQAIKNQWFNAFVDRTSPNFSSVEDIEVSVIQAINLKQDFRACHIVAFLDYLNQSKIFDYEIGLELTIERIGCGTSRLKLYRGNVDFKYARDLCQFKVGLFKDHYFDNSTSSDVSFWSAQHWGELTIEQSPFLFKSFKGHYKRDNSKIPLKPFKLIYELFKAGAFQPLSAGHPWLTFNAIHRHNYSDEIPNQINNNLTTVNMTRATIDFDSFSGKKVLYDWKWGKRNQLIYYADTETITRYEHPENFDDQRHRCFLTCAVGPDSETLNKKVIRPCDYDQYYSYFGENGPKDFLVEVVREAQRLIQIDVDLFKVSPPSAKIPEYNLSSILYFHNLSYDLRFFIPFVNVRNLVMRGSRILQATTTLRPSFLPEYRLHPSSLELIDQCKREPNCPKLKRALYELYRVKNMPVTIIFKDSYALLSMPLRSFAASFKLDIRKEIMAYDAYTYESVIERHGDLTFEETLPFVPEEQHQEYLDLVNDQIFEDRCSDFHMLKYAEHYCRKDCEVLQAGLRQFKKDIQGALDLSIHSAISISSIAHRYLLVNRCYEDVYELSNLPRLYIQKCVYGGRVMTRKNQAWHVQEKLIDADVNSLYPTASSQLGFLKGIPHPISSQMLDEVNILASSELVVELARRWDGYFVRVNIKTVPIELEFPLIPHRFKNSLDYLNQPCEGCFLDKTTLEEIILYHRCEVEIVDGYYFNEGRNYNIQEVIRHMYAQRLEAKAKKDTVQLCWKLAMNSTYGKTLLKPVKHDLIFKDSDNLASALFNNSDRVKEVHQCNSPTSEGFDTYIIKVAKATNTHFSLPHVGVEILSQSKRIMNKIFHAASEVDMTVYYQDTDSVHVPQEGFENLKAKYLELYGEEFEGKELGQTLPDFEASGFKDLVSVESFFVGKKAYLDILEGTHIETGERRRTHHVRLKGIPYASILEAARQRGENVEEGLLNIFNQFYSTDEPVTFDLLVKGPSFDMRPDMSIVSRREFIRKIKFTTPIGK